jgi:hypothetical protein
MLIVPDSKPPYLLLGAGVVLLAGLVIRTLRRERRTATPASEATVVGTWKTEERPAPVRALPRRTRGSLRHTTATTSDPVTPRARKHAPPARRER